ncbi:MAG: TonB-dependent receptor [Ignavibacteriales bacterium]|nr:TonB-dependent receptor [Ignavibacteriales bacterium]
MSGKPHDVFLPRFALSVVPSDRSRLYFSAGAFAQYVPLQSVLVTSRELSPWYTSVFSARTGPLSGHLLKPERSTLFEAGYTVSSDNNVWTLALRAHHKRMTGLAQMAWEDTISAQWLVFKNDGEATVQGLEVNLLLQPDRRFSAVLSYTLSSVRGTSTTAREPWGQLAISNPTVLEEILSPLGYDQTHRGFLMLDIRFGREDGAVLDGLRIAPIFSFHSGHRYTLEHEPTFLGASTVWLAGVRSLLDPRAVDPMELPNESSTPWYFNADLRVEKTLLSEPVRAMIAVDVLNLFNRRHVINVYPTSGTATDTWLASPIGDNFASIPGFADAYTTFNVQNRWAYMRATGNDIYGTPRQIRIGLVVEM